MEFITTKGFVMHYENILTKEFLGALKKYTDEVIEITIKEAIGGGEFVYNPRRGDESIVFLFGGELDYSEYYDEPCKINLRELIEEYIHSSDEKGREETKECIAEHLNELARSL